MAKLKIKNNEVAFFAMGGLGEIGKNMYCVQFQDEIVIIDCGVLFPEDELLGVDYVIQNYDYLVENKDKIKGIFITHGHEDHIGGLPFFLQKVNVPIYATPFAMSLIKGKLDEKHLLRSAELHEINEFDEVHFKKLWVSFFRTTHSIPDTIGVAVHTPQGTIVQTGDFKFDLTPVGHLPGPNLQQMAKLGDDGVLLLTSDSTNAERPQFTKSERWVDIHIRRIFERIKGRIIFASFASNVYRLREASDAAIAQGRKIAVFGRSMENAIAAGQELGYLNIPKESLIDQNKINNYPPEKVLIMCTGSQGEPMAALSRIANGTHRQISIQPGDTVVFSSNPIPGNTTIVNALINKLEEDGAAVVHGYVNNIHTSGHGGQIDEEFMLRLMKPKFFAPVHGEYRMQKIHTKLAQMTGVPKENCFILENGDVLALTKDSCRLADHIDSVSDVYIDGRDAGDTVGNPEIRERRLLSEEGVVTAIAVVNLKDYQIVAGPDIVSRGFVYMHESQELIKAANHEAFWAILNTFKNHKVVDQRALNRTIVSRLQKLLFDRTGRKPVIIPMITILNGDNRTENHHYRHSNRKSGQHEGKKGHQGNNHGGHHQHRSHNKKNEKTPVASK
ncbi:ribonuclease J1 [Limosilactobacillus pontis]|uniref:Ribonuclease J n=1 Tax=Limosilactobacillus pontis DSM 8475 TaxID=1423794 RepID=A0A922PTW3_9LACO|nr:ribonuclease J [Limosilactobacillus pontis]KRM35518.1 metallo-beta-lactamase [Limosilactobacillus pontis DSM 8475]QFV01445.1 RNase J family beta-CASP ribonuclease [Limosilactobacillus pontis]